MSGDEMATERLRAGMRDLVDGERIGAAPVAEVIRRSRARRRAVGAVAGVLACSAVAVAVALSVSVSAGGSGGGTTGPAAAPTTIEATTATPSAPALARRTVTPGTSPVDPGRAAVPGQAYPVDWGAHCGLGYLPFAGRMWRADTLVETPAGLPGPQGPNSGPPILPGYATPTSPDHLRFDAPGYLDRPITLTPIENPPLCD
ncbi:hypothetical protein [Embleya sp. NBC_00896]|uniref:hypothetical protein n=1 Tax=Embleya sp. NBC_00896 TaxID=2975961 RepID=UPI00386557D2|nr:hypothetical protein OG928_13835 [Embleya sp. NBC_00896]